MKKFLIPVVVLTMTLVFFGNALAAEFSAEMVIKSQGQTMHSKIYMKNNKIRMETKGEGIHSIVRMDKNVMWVVMPEEKSYMEVQSDQAQIPGEKMKGEVSRKYIGSETVNG